MPHDEESQKPKAIQFIDKHFDWFLSGFVILIGFAFLYAAGVTPKESAWHEITRDVGIALIIAAVVSVTYETFARSRFIRHTMEAMLSEIFGNIVQPDVWKVVKDEVIRHLIIRECLDIHLALRPEFGDDSKEMVLWMRITYDLKGLHDSPESKPLPFRHFLDDHIVVGKYPCFDLIAINGIEQPLNGVTRGVFETVVPLNHKQGAEVKITSERNEITYVPGSYYLTMTELTKGIKLHLTELPEGVEAFVNIRPYKEGTPLRKNVPIDDEFKNTILLPGQSIEFRFGRKRQPQPAQGGVT